MRSAALTFLICLIFPIHPALAVASDDSILPLLKRYCHACHGGEKPKAHFAVDHLASDFADEATRDRWLLVRDRVQAGEMPPEGNPKPTGEQIRAITAWIDAQVTQVETAEQSQGRVAARRLNRVEYQNTVRDLLGVEVDFTDLLPEDTSAEGFDNVASGQHISSFLLERYLEAADRALALAIANGPQPPLMSKRYHLQEERHLKTNTERVFRQGNDALVLFSSSPWQAIHLRQFYPPDRGAYRFRISAGAIQSEDKPVTFRVDAGKMLQGTRSHLVGYFDAPAGEPAIIEFVDHLEDRSTIRILPYGLASAQAVDAVGADNWQEPGLAIQWVDVEGPLHATWPPESHRRIFGDLPQEAAPVYRSRDRVEVVSTNPKADAERILRDFARRAFRRAVTKEDIGPFLALVEARLAEGRSFESAVRVGLTAVMVSPDFLFLREKPGQLDDFALASRLSYFLWSSMPDEELLAIAQEGKLRNPDILHRQVERLLNDPKSMDFVENFTGQWLSLREIDFTEPSHILYPEFDDLLKASMVRETQFFFAEVLRDDLSLTNFIASDFSMLNGRLAKHYGIPDVEGWEFQKVTLPPESHRGGVLTMASVLKVTANGTLTSPVLRGAWVLDRILGTPPNPPPADISPIEPDIRGASTIREQLAKHRHDVSCASCHSRIDPPGFALESFDVIGGWREYYRTTGLGERIVVDGERMRYLRGPAVDPSHVMPDGTRFANIDQFKQLLLRDKDQLARALTAKLVTYATGAAPTTADQPEVEAIVAAIREEDFGLRSLIHEIVRSEIFQAK